MTRSIDTWLGAILWLNAAVFLVGSIAGWTFDQWLIPDIVAILVFGLIGFVKRIRILQIAAVVIIAGMLLRLSTALWLAIDLFIIGISLYVGYRFLKEKISAKNRVAVPGNQ